MQMSLDEDFSTPVHFISFEVYSFAIYMQTRNMLHKISLQYTFSGQAPSPDLLEVSQINFPTHVNYTYWQVTKSCKPRKITCTLGI